MQRLLVAVVVAGALAAASADAARHGKYSPKQSMAALWYAKSAYCNATDILPWTCGSCGYAGNALTSVEVQYNTSASMGYTGYNPATNQIVVVFRGTVSVLGWLFDFDFTLVDYASCSDCQVHEGFYKAYNNIGASVIASVKTLLVAHPSASVLVTGHSLGAALSLLGAMDILEQLKPKHLDLYNFGEPRVGNPAFAAFAAKKLPQKRQFRVTHSEDPVPHLPPQFFGFLHAPHEEFYNNNGNTSWVSCKDSATAEDPNCSDQFPIPTDFADHTLYLGVCVGCDCTTNDVDLGLSQERLAAVMKRLRASN